MLWAHQKGDDEQNTHAPRQAIWVSQLCCEATTVKLEVIWLVRKIYMSNRLTLAKLAIPLDMCDRWYD